MSPGAPSAPVSYIPTPTAAVTYQSLIPQQSYQDAANYLQATNNQLNKQLQVQYQQVGTPAEIGARQAGYRLKENAAYLASIPTEKQGTPAYGAIQGLLTQSQQDYGKALESAKTAPAYDQFSYQFPSWAAHSDESWAVKPDSSTTPAPTSAQAEAAATSTTQGGLLNQYQKLVQQGKVA